MKIGKIKATVDQADDSKLLLTAEETEKLATLLENARGSAEESTTEKVQGVIALEIEDGKIILSTSKVKIAQDEEEDI